MAPFASLRVTYRTASPPYIRRRNRDRLRPVDPAPIAQLAVAVVSPAPRLAFFGGAAGECEARADGRKSRFPETAVGVQKPDTAEGTHCRFWLSTTPSSHRAEGAMVAPSHLMAA
jgi:hypothetical protein